MGFDFYETANFMCNYILKMYPYFVKSTKRVMLHIDHVIILCFIRYLPVFAVSEDMVNSRVFFLIFSLFKNELCSFIYK